GCRLAASLGHPLVPPCPALVPVIVERAAFAPFVRCAGVSLSAATGTVVREGRRVAKLQGDVLFTHRGLSGPAVLDLSRYVLRGDVLRVSLVPGLGDVRAAEQRLAEEIEAHGKRTVVNLLQGLGLATCLARAVVVAAHLDPRAKAAEICRPVRRSLATSLAAGGEGGHPFPVLSLGGWSEAMVTQGGVCLSEVDPKTMGSRLVPGLFFAGEILDVDGDTGGYNLQAAVSTGRLAGRNAAQVPVATPGPPAPRDSGQAVR
ncbi:TPA: hypothetical protein DCY65_05095, partial [Candidatus Acetothermia bacterium]|nr:hypothetical protein [Candidatus Acetothermia bacterium]